MLISSYFVLNQRTCLFPPILSSASERVYFLLFYPQPENVFISSDKGWKLGDFGVSKFKFQNMGTMFGRHTANMGTALYMAPEVVSCADRQT